MEACLAQRFADLPRLFAVPCFHANAQKTGVDGHVCFAPVMVHGHHIAAVLRNDAADAFELAGLVRQRDGDVAVAPGRDQPALDDLAEDIHIDIAAGYHTAYHFAL